MPYMKILNYTVKTWNMQSNDVYFFTILLKGRSVNAQIASIFDNIHYE